MLSGRGTRALLVAALLALLAAIWAVSGSDVDPEDADDAPVAADSAHSEPPTASGPRRAPDGQPPSGSWARPSRRAPAVETPPAAPPPSEPECTPGASQTCHQGDVYDVDSCGARGERVEDCGDRLCRGGRCDAPEPGGCGQETAFGRCAGRRVRVCLAGRVSEIDCAATGRQCAITDDGAACVRPSGPACDGEVPACVDGGIEFCAEGRWQVIDCAGAGGVCESAPDGARCVLERTLAERVAGLPGGLGPGPAGEGGCGPCGCRAAEPGVPGPEVCDGYDNDGDGEADEDTDCGEVPLVAFVVTDSGGGASYSDEDIFTELHRVQTVFAQLNPHAKMNFQLLDIVRLPRPAWLATDQDAIAEMMADPAVQRAFGAFYVPVVFTDVVHSGGVPRYGSGTLPPGACNGLRPGSPSHAQGGLVVVSKARHPTTVAHELGHFFGLCHTHQAIQSPVVERVRFESGEAVSCEGCRLHGDGVCDTPPDPGPQACGYTSGACVATCADGAQPDASNLMSYYHECRWALTDEQGILLRRGLALRRAAWGGTERPGALSPRRAPEP